MDTLRLRPPQFSEDLAWLPPWLQNPQTEQSVEYSKDLQPYLHRPSIVNLECGIDKGSLSNESGGYYSCHLQLFGEDDSTRNSAATSSNNALHLHLHLSSDSGSHYSEIQSLCTPRALPVFDKVLSAKQGCISAKPGKKTSPPKVHNNDDQIKFSNQTYLPMSVEYGRPLCPTNKIDGKWQCEWLSTTHNEDSDVKHAVELSTAASEALVIYELMQTGPHSEALPTEAILEAALRIKQARLETSKHSFCYSSHEADETDFLSDLNDSIMADAWKDVGLCFIDRDDEHDGDMSLSYVKDTPVSEGHRSNHLEPVSLQDRVVDDSFSSLNSLNAETCKAMPHQLSEKQVEVQKNSFHACILDKAVEKENLCFHGDRYRSRWFGGWTVKEENSCVNIKQDNTKSMKRDFVRETSFLSESADAAPDQNSLVKNHENRPKISSQCSVQFNGHLRGEEDEVFPLSQDFRSSSQSFVDPLCSVVPCSISIDNVGSPSSQEHNGGQSNRTCFNHRSEFLGENLCKVSNLNTASVCVVGKDVPMLKGESCGTSVQRKLTSLKTYSTLPINGVIESLHNNQLRQSGLLERKLSSYEDVCCKEFFDMRNANYPFPSNALYKCDIDREAMDIRKSNALPNPVAGRANQTKSQNEPTKDGDDLHACALVKGTLEMSPSREVTNVHSFRVYANNSTAEGNPDQFVTKDSTLRTCQIKTIEKLQSELDSTKNTPNLSRKRVSFSGVQFELQLNKGIQKQLSLHRTCAFMDHIKHDKKLIFHGLKFLVTGFSTQQEMETVRLVTKHGGVVLSDVPSAPSITRANRILRCNTWHLPVIICSKKLQTAKFLYGCAVNALILQRNWLTDSIATGFLAPPEKYLVLPNNMVSKDKRFRMSVYHGENEGIFHKLGIILHGKHKFCSKLEVIIKHGGGIVFKNLQKLIQSLDANKISTGVIVAENEKTLRHLTLCAWESKIPMMPASWVTKSLHLGELLPVGKKQDAPSVIEATKSKFVDSTDWSQEI